MLLLLLLLGLSLLGGPGVGESDVFPSFGASIHAKRHVWVSDTVCGAVLAELAFPSQNKMSQSQFQFKPRAVIISHNQIENQALIQHADWSWIQYNLVFEYDAHIDLQIQVETHSESA